MASASGHPRRCTESTADAGLPSPAPILTRNAGASALALRRGAASAVIVLLTIAFTSCWGSERSAAAFSRAIGSEGGAFGYVPESLEAYVNEADLVVRGRIVDVSNHVKEKVAVEDISYEVSYYHLVVEVTEVIAGSLGDGEWSEGIIHIVMDVGDHTSFGAIDGSVPGAGIDSVHFLSLPEFAQDPQRVRDEPLWVHTGPFGLLMKGSDGSVLWGGEYRNTPRIFRIGDELGGDVSARSYDVLLARIRAAAVE